MASSIKDNKKDNKNNNKFMDEPPVKKAFSLNGFRRIQLTLALWGVLMLVGGWLHNTNAKAWGVTAMLLIWLGLTLLGFIGAQLAAPEFMASGFLFRWVLVLILPFFLTWLIYFPLQGKPYDYVSSIWHWAFALGYFFVGYGMDRRFWWLAGWEIFCGLFMLLLNLDLFDLDLISKNQGIALGFSSGLALLLAALPTWKERYDHL